jgi:hypothetical protein
MALLSSGRWLSLTQIMFVGKGILRLCIEPQLADG